MSPSLPENRQSGRLVSVVLRWVLGESINPEEEIRTDPVLRYSVQVTPESSPLQGNKNGKTTPRASGLLGVPLCALAFGVFLGQPFQ